MYSYYTAIIHASCIGQSRLQMTEGCKAFVSFVMKQFQALLRTGIQAQKILSYKFFVSLGAGSQPLVPSLVLPWSQVSSSITPHFHFQILVLSVQLHNINYSRTLELLGTLMSSHSQDQILATSGLIPHLFICHCECGVFWILKARSMHLISACT